MQEQAKSWAEKEFASRKAKYEASQPKLLESASKIEKVNQALRKVSGGFGEGNSLTHGYVTHAQLGKEGVLEIRGEWKSYDDRQRDKTYNYDINVNGSKIEGNSSRLDDKDLKQVVKVVNMNGGLVKKIRLSLSPWIS